MRDIINTIAITLGALFIIGYVFIGGIFFNGVAGSQSGSTLPYYLVIILIIICAIVLLKKSINRK